jgi:amino acid transporter
MNKTITVSALGFMTAASIVTSLRGLPMMAKEEMEMFFYIGFAVILFLIPAGLVAAELGGAFGNREGGIYVWVGEAFGKPVGFIAIFLSWVQNIVFYPTGLSFAAAALAFTLGAPELATNNIYVGLFTIIAFWLCTFVALVSAQFAAKVTQYGFILGTAIPGLILIGGLLWWILTGHTIGWAGTTDPSVAILTDGHVHPRWFPYVTNLGGLAFLAGILLSFAGVESQAVHTNELSNPRKGYPIVIVIAALVSFLIFTLGALAVAGILPYEKINLQTGVFDTFSAVFMEMFGSAWPVPILSLLICYGALGGVLAWITGPSRGLLATAHDGKLPPWMQKTTKTGVQKNILIIQGIVVTALSAIYLVVTDVSVVFFLITAMAISLYIIVYLLMYAAAIRLRYTQPDLERSFKIPGGNFGMWLVAGLGFAAVAFAFVLAFVPPDQLPIGNPAMYVALVAGGAIIFTAAPIVLEWFRKDSWLPPEDQAARLASDRVPPLERHGLSEQEVLARG